MKPLLTTIPLIFINILIGITPELRIGNSISEFKLQDKSPEIIIHDKNNKVIGKSGVSLSDASTIYIKIKSDNEKDIFIIQSGKIYIPDQEPRSFTGPMLTVVNRGTVVISVDKLARKLEDGTLEEVKLKDKFVNFVVN